MVSFRALIMPNNLHLNGLIIYLDELYYFCCIGRISFSFNEPIEWLSGTSSLDLRPT